MNTKNKFEAPEKILKQNVNFSFVSDFLFQNREKRPDGTIVDPCIDREEDESIWDHSTNERLIRPILYWKD